MSEIERGPVGSSGVEISRIGLGCYQLGPEPGEGGPLLRLLPSQTITGGPPRAEPDQLDGRLASITTSTSSATFRAPNSAE